MYKNYISVIKWLFFIRVKSFTCLIDDATDTMVDSIRCLALLLISTKVKNFTGNIPYVIKLCKGGFI